jgi:NADH-quinone oxidoreductase subunit G
MPTFKINGKEVSAAPGEKVLPVALDNGFFVPHYCWHRGLTPAGNCRMCLVKVSNSRKLEVACMYPVSDNLEVTTEGPEIEAGRKAVLEYMLINHPLDCPICDKAGECDLQDFTYNYRKGVSRFEEDKVIKHTKDLGPNIKIWGNRCIACTRCVRFCEEIVGTGELVISNRGDHSCADIHPDVPLDNPMSLNVVDLCPVGALIDKNFLYQARVWFTTKVESVCTSCSRGCNITATTIKSEIKRLRPRYNGAVNDWWLCDRGRLNFGHVRSEKRLFGGKGTSKDLALGAKAVAEQHGPGSVAILASTYATNEELFAIRKLADALGATVAFHTKVEGARWVSKSGFSIETDKTPNTAGAKHQFGDLQGVEAVVHGIEQGRIKGLISINGIPDYEVPVALAAAVRKLDFFAAGDFESNALTEAAPIVMASACWAEKDGTFTNKDGRIQRVKPILLPPGVARSELVWLQEALVALGAARMVLSAEAVFKAAFPGLDYKQVGAQGIVPAAAPANAADNAAVSAK